MKIAILSQPFDLVLPPEQTSIGIWTYEVARRLAPECDLTILARRPRGAPSQAIGDWGRLEFLPTAPLRLWTHASQVWSRIHPAAATLIGQRFYAFDYLQAALRRLRTLDPDVIHIQNFPHFAPPIRKAFPRAAIVLHMHCDWLVELDGRAVGRHLEAVDTVIGCSAHVAGEAEARFCKLPSRFAVVPNGAPPGAPRADNLERAPGRVIFVGRVSPEKGIHTLLEAWPKIATSHPGAHLDIIGPPSVTPREFLVDLSADPDVRALARFYRRGKDSFGAALRALVPPDIAHTVTFVGHEPHARVMARMAQAAVLANPSLSESFGMSLVEALSVATPVVATRVGGMTEILQATEGGLLVEKNDPRALGEAILALLADQSRAAALGRRGAERARALYSWNRIASLTHDVHLEALSQRRRETEACSEVGSSYAGRRKKL